MTQIHIMNDFFTTNCYPSSGLHASMMNSRSYPQIYEFFSPSVALIFIHTVITTKITLFYNKGASSQVMLT